jgi:hypothetical protein
LTDFSALRIFSFIFGVEFSIQGFRDYLLKLFKRKLFKKVSFHPLKAPPNPKSKE